MKKKKPGSLTNKGAGLSIDLGGQMYGLKLARAFPYIKPKMQGG